MVWPDGYCVVYGMALRAWHGHGMVLSYSLVDMAWYMVIVGGHGIWYGLSGMAWHMVWLGVPGMVYGLAWKAWHGI